jgi:hypothetical protein
MLRIAACIGSSFKVSLLSLISKQSVEEVEAALHPAIDLSYLVPNTLEPGSLSFVHDRIQYAAYAVPARDQEDTKAIHLRIGKELLEQFLAPILANADAKSSMVINSKRTVTAAMLLPVQNTSCYEAANQFIAGLDLYREVQVMFKTVKQHIT